MITFKKFLESEQGDYEWKLALMAEYRMKSDIAAWAVKWLKAEIQLQDLPGDTFQQIVDAVPYARRESGRPNFLEWLENQLQSTIDKFVDTQ